MVCILTNPSSHVLPGQTYSNADIHKLPWDDLLKPQYFLVQLLLNDTIVVPRGSLRV